MKSVIACLMLMVASSAFAGPVSIRVKQGLLIKPDDTEVTVDAGMFINEEGRLQTLKTVSDLQNNNSSLSDALNRANQKILDCAPYIAGLPAWAYVVISVGLSAITATAGYFAAKSVAK